MPFTEAFIALVPDADARRDRTVLETKLYRLVVALVRDEDAAAELSRELVGEGVESIALCPGFTNRGVARIDEAVGDKIAVSVARGDGAGTQLVQQGLERAGWF